MNDRPDLGRDLMSNPYIVNRVQTDPAYAQSLYAALCNNRFQKQDVMVVLKDEFWTCSWRFAGGLVADLGDVGGDYLDWYCSGSEGHVTDEIRFDLALMGWQISKWPDD